MYKDIQIKLYHLAYTFLPLYCTILGTTGTKHQKLLGQILKLKGALNCPSSYAQ